MEGWRLWHDHTAKPMSVDDDDDEGVAFARGHEGNALRDVWKANCLHLSNDESILLHERAVYATLCGNLGQLLRVCHSWEDALWAHFRVLVDRTVEQKLREVPMEHRGAPEDLPEWYNDTVVDPADVFEELQASAMESISNGANEALHRIQVKPAAHGRLGLMPLSLVARKENKTRGFYEVLNGFVLRACHL